MKVINARNVNDALYQGMDLMTGENLRDVSPRGHPTLEYPTPVSTVYAEPCERVLFYPNRRANPIFHFIESLWILNGSNDVALLSRFNPRMAEYSDDGITFNAPYGHRLRHEFGFDQIDSAIRQLQDDHDTRRVVMSIWDPLHDMGIRSHDIPCNDTVMLKIRDGKLHMLVANRSNDMIWGAYGANAVQFSMLLEMMATAIGVPVGTYTQVSDSFHVYTDGPGGRAYNRLKNIHHSLGPADLGWEPYLWISPPPVAPYRIMRTPYCFWKQDLTRFIVDIRSAKGPLKEVYNEPFFNHVAKPIFNAWTYHQQGDVYARSESMSDCKAIDWQLALFIYFSEV